MKTSRLARAASMGALIMNVGSHTAFKFIQNKINSDPKKKFNHLLLSEQNLLKIGKTLADLRGAAMKIGQLISMDAGNILPEPLAELLSSLRNEATFMKQEQVNDILTHNWGDNWMDEFDSFSFTPCAAASIGQVHKGILKNGQSVAVKIQYPGIKKSINSDVDNLMTILNLLKILPKNIDYQSVLNEAKTQLKEEADYTREAHMIEHFSDNFNIDNIYIPKVIHKFSNETILTTEWFEGKTIDKIENLNQETRNLIAETLVLNICHEFFVHQMVQTDPNIANFLFNQDTKQIGIIDFGASMKIKKRHKKAFKKLIIGMANNEDYKILEAAFTLGYINKNADGHYINEHLKMFHLIKDIFSNQIIDFENIQVVKKISNIAYQLRFDPQFYELPETEVLYMNRKLAGTFLILQKLKAKINIHQIIMPFITKNKEK